MIFLRIFRACWLVAGAQRDLARRARHLAIADAHLASAAARLASAQRLADAALTTKSGCRPAA